MRSVLVFHTLTTSYIRVLHFCGQVPFLYVIIVGFVAVGQARLSRSTSRCTTWSTEDHGTPHSAHSRSAVLPHAEQMTLQRWRKKMSALSRTHVTFTHHLSHATLLHTYTYIHTYNLFTYFLVLSHTVFHIPLCHTQLFYFLDLSPPPLSSFPVPATTFEAHYWKKLTCGVVRSFNYFCFFFVFITPSAITIFFAVAAITSSGRRSTCYPLDGIKERKSSHLIGDDPLLLVALITGKK